MNQSANTSTNFSVLDAKQYSQTIKTSRSSVESILAQLKPLRDESMDKQMALLARKLADLPYLSQGDIGEGDWQPNSLQYKSGALHVQQNPVYRLDGFDCQSFVQTAMGLLYSDNLDAFDRNILKIAYGAAGNPQGEIVRYYNRNNFIDGDFNPINQRNGFLTDVTTSGSFKHVAAITSANLTRQNWFSFQQKKLAKTVRVLKDRDGNKMAERFMKVYSQLNYPNFKSEKVVISYLPKSLLAVHQANGGYQPDQVLLNKIPTPSIIEIIDDTKIWEINGINIKNLVGSELNVSHLGIAYREEFKQGEFIYHKIICSLTARQEKSCIVTPIVCQKKKCNELMFVHATNAYPNNFYWYQRNGNFVCSPNPPTNAKPMPCNRVERIPFFNYLTDFQYGSYWHMGNPAILGIHIEKLV